MLELAYVYVDLGDDRFMAYVHEMVQSAKRVMPGVKITQISDRKTPMYPEADALFAAEVDCDKENICAFKGHFMADFAIQCDNPLILCDVDLIWQHQPKMPDFSIHVMQRDNMPSMPINTGLILSSSDNGAKVCWESYQEVIDNLHANGMGGWYCDQIAAAIDWHGDETIYAFPMQEWAYVPSSPDDDGGKDAYAVHFKGNRKKWLRNFAKRVA